MEIVLGNYNKVVLIKYNIWKWILTGILQENVNKKLFKGESDYRVMFRPESMMKTPQFQAYFIHQFWIDNLLFVNLSMYYVLCIYEMIQYSIMMAGNMSGNMSGNMA